MTAEQRLRSDADYIRRHGHATVIPFAASSIERAADTIATINSLSRRAAAAAIMAFAVPNTSEEVRVDALGRLRDLLNDVA